MSRFLLLPINEGDSERTIQLPPNIYSAPKGDKDLIRMCSTVFEIKDGKMYHNGKDLEIPYREFLSDTSKSKFLIKYEPVYDILCSNGYQF